MYARERGRERGREKKLKLANSAHAMTRMRSLRNLPRFNTERCVWVWESVGEYCFSQLRSACVHAELQLRDRMLKQRKCNITIFSKQHDCQKETTHAMVRRVFSFWHQHMYSLFLFFFLFLSVQCVATKSEMPKKRRERKRGREGSPFSYEANLNICIATNSAPTSTSKQ